MDWGERIGRRLKLRDLHILLAVVHAATWPKPRVARGLQPGRVEGDADLEHTLGVRLLDRSAARRRAHDLRAALLDRGLMAFDELRQAVKDIDFLADPAAGEVRVGASIAAATTFVVAVVNRLSRRYPRIISIFSPASLH